MRRRHLLPAMTLAALLSMAAFAFPVLPAYAEELGDEVLTQAFDEGAPTQVPAEQSPVASASPLDAVAPAASAAPVEPAATAEPAAAGMPAAVSDSSEGQAASYAPSASPEVSASEGAPASDASVQNEEGHTSSAPSQDDGQGTPETPAVAQEPDEQSCELSDGQDALTAGAQAGTQDVDRAEGADDQSADDLKAVGTQGAQAEEESEPLWRGLYELVTDASDLSGVLVMRLGESELAFDPKSGSVSEGTAVQAYNANDSVNQRFALRENADGTYRITGVKSGLVMSLADNVVEEGVAVVLAKATGAIYQNWLISTDEGSGFMRIVNAANELLAICLQSGKQKGSALVLGDASGIDVALLALYRAVPTISDGTYVISSGRDDRFVVDCAGGTAAKGNNVQVWTANSSNTQHMKLTWDEKVGYYRIDCKGSGLVLDCVGGNTTNGTNVRLWASNGTIAQRWSLALKDDGSFDIRSAKSGLQLAPEGNNVGLNANIAIYTASTNKNRLWRFASDAPVTPTSELDAQLAREAQSYCLWNGIYLPVLGIKGNSGPVVLCLTTTNLVLDPQSGKTVAGTNVKLYVGNDTINQRFSLVKNGDGSYRIVGLKSNLCLGIVAGTIKAGLAVVLQKPTTSVRQKWLVNYDKASNLFKFVSMANKRYALCTSRNVRGGQLVLGTVAKASKFELYRPVAVIPDGTYRIENKANSKLVIDSSGSKAAKGADVQLGTFGNQLTQQLRFVWDAQTGYYRIFSSTTAFVIDCKSGGVKAGTNVQLWGYNGTIAQLWSLCELSGNYGYDIRSAKSGLQVGLTGSTVEQGASLAIYSAKIWSQRGWYLRRTAQSSSDASTSQKLEIPTSWYGDDETNQAYHPKVIAFEKAWNGYKYWMAYTPYPKQNSYFEDPCIVASNDLWHWEVPAGLSNPIDDLHDNGTNLTYNSDTHLLYNPDTKMLELYWRTKDHDDIYLYRATSRNGSTWSKKKLIMHRVGVAVDDALSPVVMYEDGTYRMWYVADNWGTVRYTESTDGTTWDEARTLVIPYDNTGIYTWHLDVIKTDKGYEALLSAHMQRNNLQSMSLWHSISDDGITGWSVPEVVLEPTTGTRNWDNQGLYRSSLLYLDDTYYVYYSGHDTESYTGTGLATGTSLSALKRVTEDSKL